MDWVLEQANAKFGPREFARGEAPCVNMVAHNLAYDLSQIISSIYNIKSVEQGTKVWGLDAYYRNDVGHMMRIHFSDSYKLISSPLRVFYKMFDITSTKEVMPHSIMTHEFV
jgi:hypothetical protein